MASTSDTPVNLAGATFDGISYTFPPATPTLLPGEALTLARNPEFLASQATNLNIFDRFAGQLSNGGEPIRLVDIEGNPIAAVTYDDERGWPVTADGHGDSLILVNLQGDPDDPGNWRGSSQQITAP